MLVHKDSGLVVRSESCCKMVYPMPCRNMMVHKESDPVVVVSCKVMMVSGSVYLVPCCNMMMVHK